MATKKESTKKPKETLDVNLNIKNIEDYMKKSKKKENDKFCSRGKCGGGHFWMFGSALAMILSYERSASILWAILHGIFSWFYILFRAMQIWGWF